MWQAANAAWMDDESNLTELIPFRYSDSEFWTSERCRYLPDMGYTYPDLALIKDRPSLIARVNNLYSDAPQAQPGRSRSMVPPDTADILGLDVDEYVVTAKYET